MVQDIQPKKPHRGDEPIFSTLFKSEVRVALLVLFHGNPGITDTSEGVARRIGRSGREVGPDLEDFVRMGILRKRTLGKDTEVYCLDQSGDRKMQGSLDKYFRNLGAQPDVRPQGAARSAPSSR